jgi:hypothetical protein
MHRRSAGRQDPDGGGRDQDRADQGRGGQDLLEVVEHEE